MQTKLFIGALLLLMNISAFAEDVYAKRSRGSFMAGAAGGLVSGAVSGAVVGSIFNRQPQPQPYYQQAEARTEIIQQEYQPTTEIKEVRYCHDSERIKILEEKIIAIENLNKKHKNNFWMDLIEFIAAFSVFVFVFGILCVLFLRLFNRLMHWF